MTEKQMKAFDEVFSELLTMKKDDLVLEMDKCEKIFPMDWEDFYAARQEEFLNKTRNDSILDDDVANAIKAKGLEYRIALNQFLRQTLIANCL